MQDAPGSPQRTTLHGSRGIRFADKVDDANQEQQPTEPNQANGHDKSEGAPVWRFHWKNPI